MINSIIEISEVGVQLLEWRVRLHLRYDSKHVGNRLRTLPSHLALDEPKRFSLRTQTSKERHRHRCFIE